ncbi:MAG: kynureninase, partial [Planctomycetota bacterium]
MSINPLAAHWRERFPTVQEKTYLVSHSLGAVPASAAAALREMYDAWATLGVAAWDGPWWEAVLEFCATMEAILHAEPGSVVPMLNATRAMAGVASCYTWEAPRNRIVMTDIEFPTNYALWRGCEKLG